MSEKIPQESAFMPRVPPPGVVFTVLEQEAVDAIDWAAAQRRLFAGAMILKNQQPIGGGATNVSLVQEVIELAHVVQEQVTALREQYRQHDNREYIRNG